MKNTNLFSLVSEFAKLKSQIILTEKLINELLNTDNEDEECEMISVQRILKECDISAPTLKKYREEGLISPVNKGYRKIYRKKDIVALITILKGNGRSS